MTRVLIPALLVLAVLGRPDQPSRFALWWSAVALAEAEGRPLRLSAAAFAQPQQPQQQDEFVPIDQLPPQDQLPAAPLLIAAYSFVALALFTYLVSLARRLTVVQREIERLESDLKRTGRT